MAAKNFLVMLPSQDSTPARVIVNGVEGFLISAETAADAKALAKAQFDQDVDPLWGLATATEVVADTSLHGWDAKLTIFNADHSALGSVDVVADGTADAAVAAGGVLTSTDVYADGETVTVGSKTYTVKAVLTPAEGEVLIGLTEAATNTNLAHAVNGVGGTPGTDYSVAAAHPSVTAVAAAHTVTLTAKVAGVAANAVVTTETGAHTSFAAATLVGGLDAATLDRLGVALAVKLNANADLGISHAAYVASTHTLTVAGTADNRGDRTFTLRLLPANRVRDIPVASLVSSKVDGGVVGAALTAVFATTYTVPLATAGLRQST